METRQWMLWLSFFSSKTILLPNFSKLCCYSFYKGNHGPCSSCSLTAATRSGLDPNITLDSSFFCFHLVSRLGTAMLRSELIDQLVRYEILFIPILKRGDGIDFQYSKTLWVLPWICNNATCIIWFQPSDHNKL